MVRRAALAGILAAFILGVLSTEASAAGVTHHSTDITITSVTMSDGQMVVRGTLASNHGKCRKYRRVGLFPSNNHNSPLAVTKSDGSATFTLRAPDQYSSYSVIAYTQNGRCLHVCDMAVENFSF
jgi:hypothetical protein